MSALFSQGVAVVSAQEHHGKPFSMASSMSTNVGFVLLLQTKCVFLLFYVLFQEHNITAIWQISTMSSISVLPIGKQLER